MAKLVIGKVFNTGSIMALDEQVEDILNYSSMLIDTARAQVSITSMGKLCNDISKYYRALGICSLLINGDVDNYFNGLIQSALTRKYYLDRCIKENNLNDPARRTSIAGPFIDAVAANQFNLAIQIASVSPDNWWQGHEYEDDFAYAFFLHEIINFEKSQGKLLESTLHQFESALEGNTDSRMDLCKALLMREQIPFEEAFFSLLFTYEQKNNEIADPKLDSILSLDYTFEPNRWIFVEGLAILRIAKKLGLNTEGEYKYCPGIALSNVPQTFVSDSFPYVRWDIEK